MPINKLNERFDENFMQSPVPGLVYLSNLILGKKKPAGIYRYVFYSNLLISISFLFWHLTAFVSIFFRNEIFAHKEGLNVNEILMSEAHNLGFQSVDFIWKLEFFHVLSFLCWLFILFSGIILWRRLSGYLTIYFISLLAYFLLIISIMGVKYFVAELTNYDQFSILLLTLIMFLPLFYPYFNKQMNIEDDD